MNCPTPVQHGHVGQQLELLHSCGYPEDTFACKIRHLHINSGAAKSDESKLVPTGRSVTEVKSAKRRTTHSVDF
jgi:hypothetical protein